MKEVEADVVAWIESVRRSGGARLDPGRFHTIEALARRVPELQEPVKGLIETKLHRAATAYAALIEAQAAVPRIAQRVRGGSADTPLAQLNQDLRAAAAKRQAPGASATEAGPEDRHELASVRRFRQARERSRSLDQVEAAAARKPANAGPLNSHALVLESLALLRELSPDYLRRFLVHMESLQWLDQAREKLPSGAARRGTPVRARTRK